MSVAVKTDEWKIPSKLAITVIGVLLGCAISFNAWAVAALYERPTREDVKEMIEDKSPYAKDRAMVLQALARVEASNLELSRAITENTQTIAKLSAELHQWKTRTSPAH